MFEKVSPAPVDPIFGLTEEFIKDIRSRKINLTIGIYKDKNNKTPILNTVKKAELNILELERTKSYLIIEGKSEYAYSVQKLLFGENAQIIKENRIKTAQTPGGTGALRIAAEFIKHKLKRNTIWCSNPTWTNHNAIFSSVGLRIKQYSYYNEIIKDKNFTGMIEDLEKASHGDIVLLHVCSHNPTGTDLTKEEWNILAQLIEEKGLIPLFDCAYQGFSKGIEEDAYGVRTITKYSKEILVATSFSKNFSLYNERIGALTLIAEKEHITNKAFSQIKGIIRCIYSTPPAHGSNIVSMILNNPTLCIEWKNELKEMRNRIQEMRKLFIKTLNTIINKTDFDFLQKQTGMFSYLNLSQKQIRRLREEFAVYILPPGRINVSGITESNIEALCSSIAKVM
ncbi:aspartate aminotransferase [Candidatus Photodesmus katoptron]|nr:amino acid aminotransferase [Candidatus Photodesmus katoptron]KEY90703.1 aspartate aminotransferase [Candidatus Photodesmus katoptron]